MNPIIRVLLLAGLAFGSLTVQAQSARLRAANKQFENLSYVSAVRAYEEFLRADKKKDPAETREALIKLGYSYRKLEDSRNAERVYGELTKAYTELDSEIYLYYAQSLAQNGKYRESQKMYSQYGGKQKEDLRGRRFTVSYMDMSRFYQDSSSYQLYNLPINSRQADFSPMYYKVRPGICIGPRRIGGGEAGVQLEPDSFSGFVFSPRHQPVACTRCRGEPYGQCCGIGGRQYGQSYWCRCPGRQYTAVESRNFQPYTQHEIP